MISGVQWMEKNDSNDASIIGGNGLTAGGNVSLNDIKGPVNIGNTYNNMYIYEDIESAIKLLIKTADTFAASRKYDNALEYYGLAKEKLEKSKSKILLIKVMMGEAVCHHKKGNMSRSKDLVFEAESIDPKNSTVLANIASHLISENAEEAEIYAEKALELDQNNFLAKCVIGFLEYNKGNVAESLRIFRQASHIKSNVGYPIRCMAFVYSHEGDYDNAIKCGKEAIQIEPDETLFLMELARDYINGAFAENKVCISSDLLKNIKMEYLEKALEYLEKAKELSKSQGNNYLNCEIYTHLSRVYLAKGEFEKSVEYCDMVIDGGLDTVEIYIILGEAYGGCRNYDKVIEYYEPLIKREDLIGDHLFVVRANLAIAYYFKNRLNEAEKLLEELIDENPENYNLYIQMSNVLENGGHVEKALLILEKISKGSQKSWDFHYMMGRLCHKNNDYETSVQHLKEAISKDEKVIEPRIYLINLYVECRMYDFAIEQTKELIELDSTGINYYNLALLYYKTNYYEKSALFSRKALEANYVNVEAYRLLCISLLEANKASEAKDEFENALKKYPKDLELKLNYSATLSVLESCKEAIDILNEIIRDDPKCVFAYNAIARIYYKEASYEKTLEYSEKAISIEPENEDAHFVMGCSLLNLGKTEEAVKEIQKVIEINPCSNSAWLVDAEEGIEKLDNLIIIFNHTIEKYEKGNITISKTGEILNKGTFDLLPYINNEKVAKSLNLSDEKINQLRNASVNKRDILVDETILGILSKIESINLLRTAFENVFILKELEDKIVTGPYLKDHPYRELKNNLQIIDGGWIKSLAPSDMAIFAIKRIINENELSKSDISFISLALDKNFFCLTEDLLQSIQLEKINKSTCGITGLINYAVMKKILKMEDAERILEKVKAIYIIE